MLRTSAPLIGALELTMPALIDTENPDSKWFEALNQWSRIANWSTYNVSEVELQRLYKALLVLIWNEKDWLKSQYPGKRSEIEEFINGSQVLSSIGDLANQVKHRKLDRRRRSSVEQTEFKGKTTLGTGETRAMHFLRMPNGSHQEILAVLREGIYAMTLLRRKIMIEEKSREV